MGDITLDAEAFCGRLKKVFHSWAQDNTADGLWKGADAITIVVGKDADENQRSVVLHQWLLGYEMPDTVMVLCNPESPTLKVLTSKKKIDILAVLKDKAAGEGIAIECFAKEKQSNAGSIATIISAVKSSKGGANLGCADQLAKGALATEWKTAVEAAGLKTIDVGSSFSEVFMLKEAKELELIKDSAKLSSAVLKSYFIPEIEKILQDQKKVTHEVLAEKVTNAVPDVAKKLQFDEDLAEVCYTPIIQSGGKYNLKPSAESDSKRISFNSPIMCSIGARYRYYGSNIIRTLLVEPDDVQKEYYNLLSEAFEAVRNELVPGVKMNSVLEKAAAFVDKKKDGASKHLFQSCGFGTGIEFRESAAVLNKKNERKIKAGMVFSFCLGFENLKDKDGETFAVMLGDTVIVSADGPPQVVTEYSCKLDDIIYQFEDEDDAQPVPLDPKESTILPSRLRKREETTNTGDEELFKKQLEIGEKLKSEALQRWDEGGAVDVGGVKEVAKVTKIYQTPSDFPQAIKPAQIYVDMRREVIFVPICGHPVPFHINTIKNASKSDEGDYVYLRINFVVPGQTALGGRNLTLEEPEATYIRELSFRSSDTRGGHRNLNEALRGINELLKRVKTRATEKREKADLVVQGSLELLKGRPPPKLTDVQMRPHASKMGRNQKIIGALEAHQNGFRYVNRTGEKIDILYDNILHCFHQPSEKELIVLVHFHLRNPIMIGKKKTKDIQFYTEVMEAITNINERRRAFDRDEIEDEQRERELKNRLNKEFQNWVKKVESMNMDVEFDIPYRELGFYGAPYKSTVLLLPTVKCLVHLIEPPFFVVTLSEIEVVCFERVDFLTKTFDMCLVRKDYSKPVQEVKAVPITYLESIKDWLSSCEMKYYESKKTLNWTAIMKYVRSDPKQFWNEGGWVAMIGTDEELRAMGLEGDGDEDQEAESADESSFEPSEEEDDDDDYSFSEEEEDDEEEYEEEEELSEEGMDWDEMEKEARRQDRRKDMGEDSDDGGRSRKRRASESGGNARKKARR